MEQLNILAGSFSFGWQGIVGIILTLVAAGMVYVGIKVYNGFKIDFGTKANIPQEDTHVPTTAKIQNKVKTTIPDFNGNGEKPRDFAALWVRVCGLLYRVDSSVEESQLRRLHTFGSIEARQDVYVVIARRHPS